MLQTKLHTVQSLCILLFEKVDGYNRKHDGTKYLALLHSIRYFNILRSNILDVYSHKYLKIKINSDNNLSLEATLNMQSVVILIKYVFDKNHNHYHFKIFLEKCSNK